MRTPSLWLRSVLGLACLLTLCGVSADEPPTESSRLILAHYMPWYQARPVHQDWGWHWTMNAMDPEKIDEGKRNIASHFYPLIQPYDSSDPGVVEFSATTTLESKTDVSVIA